MRDRITQLRQLVCDGAMDKRIKRIKPRILFQIDQRNARKPAIMCGLQKDSPSARGSRRQS